MSDPAMGGAMSEAAINEDGERVWTHSSARPDFETAEQTLRTVLMPSGFSRDGDQWVAPRAVLGNRPYLSLQRVQLSAQPQGWRLECDPRWVDEMFFRGRRMIVWTSLFCGLVVACMLWFSGIRETLIWTCVGSGFAISLLPAFIMRPILRRRAKAEFETLAAQLES